ncbi:MAG: hypothetical protein KC561_03515 [Myxococcales bacterium]|nr:hypothetical protein [Myxococcales bacterium]
MGIDGIGGPKGPKQPGAIDKPGEVEGTNPSEKTFAVSEAQPNQPSKANEILQVIDDVAQDLKTGEVQNMNAALDKVVDRIVQTRYSGMTAEEQKRFASYLKEVLQDDPVVGEHIRQMLSA